jgi:hypothetical protein
MKLIIVAILLVAALWFGIWLGHVAERHIKPRAIAEELAP